MDMNMKKHLYRILSCVVLICAAVSAQATLTINPTEHHKICPNDTVKLTTRQVKIYSDTILYDTVIHAAVPEADTIIYVYDVNVYPPFEKTEYKELEIGQTIAWCDTVVDRAGTYVRRFQSIHGCDSIHRLVVTEHVYTTVVNQIMDTLCAGNSISFGGQTLTKGGVYYDTIHFSRYDSVTVLTLNVFKPDTVTSSVRIPEGESWEWNGQSYSEAGTYYDTPVPNRFGCDSLNALHLTTYQVDTIDTVVTICPNTTFTWHGMTKGQSGDYLFPGHRPNGDIEYYRLHLTVKELVYIDTTFTLCDEETMSFHGQTYVNAGEYYDVYTCDTTYRITIVKHPGQLYLQTGVLDRTHPYYWQYILDGEAKTDTIFAAGMYEHTSHNTTTGCNDIYRLILTKDETKFHYVETVTICENEPFDWRGRTGLNRLGIGQTIHYYDRYRTVADQDSIYELILTVHPVYHFTRTIPFCGSIVWNEKTYTESTTLVDSLTSRQFNCDSIITTILVKGMPVTHRDTVSIVTGESLSWHGMTITTEGDYTDVHGSSYGCDTTYMLHVNQLEPAHMMNTHSDWYAICQGEGQAWHNHTYYNSGTYYDTTWTTGGEIDSLYIMYLTVHPTYNLSERVSFLSFPATYRDSLIQAPGAYVFKYQTKFGCDSIITSYIDKDLYHDEQTVVICPGQTYIWEYDGQTYTNSGTYTKTETTADGTTDSVIHVLNLTVRYIPETQVEATICKGQPYIFGDETLTESGVYRHTFHKTGGCDSVVVLSLNVLSPDTTYLAIQRTPGSTYTWEGENITEPGMYFHYRTNRFGCDSVSILNFTYNQVDTVYGEFTVCQNELPFEWNGIAANQTNHYSRLVQESNGNYTLYVLDLTVRPIVTIDTTFVICEGSSISFNGVTYDAAGHYRSYLSCDTLMNVHVTVNQPAIYETHGTLGGEHGFTWTYWSAGVEHTEVFDNAGTYEYENPNQATGCNDIYRLILTKDASEYHFEETLTICEGDDFSWHGLNNLSRVTGTHTYTDAYKTRTGKDSIYTLNLTVLAIERTVRTIVFCGETTWKGVTYTNSAVVYDTTSLSNGCYHIERINLDKAQSYYFRESKDWPQGKVLIWHGQNITTDGVYYDRQTTIQGCDSVYELTVTIIPATPQSNIYAEELSACEGDTILWRDKYIWRSGVYVDTVPASGVDEVDSIFALTFTAWPAPKDTIIRHLYTCADGAYIRYNGKDYYQDTVVTTNFKTIHKCDSIVKVFMHFNSSMNLTWSDTIADTELPYTWTYQLYEYANHDTVLTKAGTYTHTTPAEGGCSNMEELTLVVFPTYLYELDTTVCETSLPLLWRGKSLQHTIGETKQYEDAYKTVNNTDSIYRINLTIVPAPKRTEYISFCENKDTIINGKSYFDPVKYPVGQVFRDTITKSNGENECDSIIYLEITKIPQNHSIETRILHVGETFDWHGITIEDMVSKTYTIEDEVDPTTGCENIYQLRVVAEQRTTKTICVLDTPYVWDWNQEKYYISGLFTDTVFDTDGKIAEYHTLELTVTDVPFTTVQMYLCEGDKETLPNGHTYHNLVPDSIYRDTITIPSPTAGCDSTIYYEIMQYPIRTTVKNEILHEGDTIFWMGDTITQATSKTYTKDSIDEVTGCKVINQLRVVAEHRDHATICVLDTPYIWSHRHGTGIMVDDSLYTTGLYSDTVRDAENFITEYLTMDLTVNVPVETYRVLRGCKPTGVTWNGVTYTKDTVFQDTLLTCDTIFTIKIKVDTAYLIEYTDTICEQDLPYILGTQNPDTIWGPRPDNKDNKYTHTDTTACGCDSTVKLTLYIIPSLTKTDSTFVCEDFFINGGFIWLGDTIDPWFEHREGGKYSGKWQGKWHGVPFDKDTIVYNCDSSHYHHIIVRPHQAHIPEYQYSLCKGDSVQLFWPHKDTWYKTPGEYYDTIPTISGWQDMKHSTMIHNDRAFACDSIVKWTIKYTDTLHVHLYEHIRSGETYIFNDSILTTTGVYDSIGYYQDIINPLDPTAPGVSSMDSAHNYCKAIYTLHLTVDPVYRYKDTIEICYPANREYTYTFDDDLEEHFAFNIQTPDKDTAIIRFSDSIKHLSYEFYDHFYDLIVYYKQEYHTAIRDTICEGDSLRFDIHNRDNTITSRYLTIGGKIYTDTLPAHNGCDSIIELYLVTRDSIPTTYLSHTVTDRMLPYAWVNTWREPGATQDSTHVDSLVVSGIYRYTMHGASSCDSTVVLNFTVHQTHVFRDTLNICAPLNKTFTHEWATGYKQQYTTPLADDTLHYYDTLITFYPLDSIYDLYVDFHQIYVTHVYDTICEGTDVRFDEHHRDNTLTQRFVNTKGTYTDTIPATNGCDSIIVLHLETIDSIPTTYLSHIITDRELPYAWVNTWREPGATQDSTHVDSLVVSGIYRYTMHGATGCDSTVVLDFTVHQTHVFRDTLAICAPINKTFTYEWATGYKQQYTTPLADDTLHYYDTLITFYPLDSIYDLYVDFHRTYETHIYDTICAGDSVQINTYLPSSLPKKFYKETGIYSETIPTFFGCDSVITLHLQVWPGFPTTHKRVDIADADTPYVWAHTSWEEGVLVRDTNYLSATGEYKYLSHNIHGCDSIDSLSLYVHKTYHIWDDEINICAHDVPFTWRGLDNITVTDDYTYAEQTVDRYDSVHYVHINVWQQTYDTVYATICEGDSMRWGMNKTTLEPRYVFTAGLHNDTTINAHGCDSIKVLHLTVHPRYYREWTVDVADVDTPYVWLHINAAGDTVGVDSLNATDKYGFRFESTYACDSIDSLNLVVHKTYLFKEEFTICERQTPYTWQDNNAITESGTYFYNPRTKDGYDSIYIATITVMPTLREIITRQICKDNLPFDFHGKDLWTGGIYVDTIASTQSGCDSIVELHLTVNDPYYHYERHDIYEGETYMFFGQPCTTSQTLIHNATTPAGCDSITEVLLVVHPLIDTVANVCAYDLPFAWVNKWTGDTTLLHAPGLYHNDTTYVNGQRTFWSIQLNVLEPLHDTIRASICAGSSYPFVGKDLKEAGIYCDTTQGSNGCDSITTLILTVNQPYYSIIREDILKGNSVEFYGNTYTTSGTYYHNARTPEGCDSTTVLQLTVHPLVDTIFTVCDNDLPVIWSNRWSGKQELFYNAGLYRNDTTINGEKRYYGIQVNVNKQVFDTIRHAMCQGASYDFKGNTYYEAGIYRDTLRANNGCDSIVTLILTVNQPYYNIIREDILEGNSVEFYGNTYTTSGTYYHNARTPEGCDSTTVLQLTVHPLVDTIFTVCDNDLPVIWNNRWSGKQELFYNAGLYRNDTTINGEKRYYGIQVNVNKQVFDTIRHAMCQGASYDFKGNTYYEAGIYRDTLRANNGCDSIVTLILTVNQPYYNIIREDILEGNSVEFYGNTYTTSGTYYHNARTPEGCDSTTVLQLTVHPLVDTIFTVCDNDLPVIWNNRWSGKQELFYNAGLYRNDTTINGEKRYYGIQVNVNKQVFDTIRHAMCQGASYDFKGNTYYEAGIYRDTLRANNGCDSIVTLILTVNQPYYNIIREDILEGNSVGFYGNTYTTSGTYYHNARTPEGCDSTTVLQLTVHPLVDTIFTVCDNDLPVIWNNRWSGKQELFYNAGLYRNDTTINGEKRYYGIQVNVNKQVFDTIRHAMCQGASYDFKGNTYYEAGIYRDTLRANNGCDSIVTLILTVNQPYYNIIRESILEGQYYVFFGDTIRETKTVSHSGRTPEGCDSTTVLELTVHQLVDTVVTVCSSELPYIWHNRWNGLEEKFYAAGTYRNDTTIDRERMYYGVKLVVTEPSSTTIYREICEGDKYNFNNRYLEFAGEYRDTIKNTQGCDSIIILHLNVLRKYYHITEKSIYEGDSVFFQGQYYKEAGAYPFRFTSSFGCDSVVELQLTVNRIYEDSVAVCSNALPYLWHNKTIYESGVYRDTVLNSEGKETVVGIKVNVLPIARAADPINVTICEGDFYKFGRNVLTEQGSYYDTLTAANGCDSIVMLALRVIPAKYQTTTKRIFEGDSALFNGVWYKESGVYEYRELNEFGCSDTYQLILTVLKTFNVDTTAVICDNELPFIWRGYEYNETGDYSLPIAWTDSSRVVKTLHLTVNNTFFAEQNISICAGDTFLFKGKQYYENGIFYDTIPSNVGCDSIKKFIISVHPTFDKVFEKHISDKQPYNFHGRDLTQTGTYEWTGKTVNGCDSLEHLILTVHPSFFQSDTIDLCQSDTSNYPYVWKDIDGRVIATISQTGVYNDSVLTEYGFDSVHQLVVNVHPAYFMNEQFEIGQGEHLKIHGKDISQPAIYYDTLRTIHGCDSIFHIVVNQKRTREFTWNKEICQGEYYEFLDGRKLTHTGTYTYTSQFKDSIVYLNLTVKPTSITEKRIVITDKQLPYFYDGKMFESAGVYTDTFSNQYGCDSIARIAIVVSTHYSEWTPIPLCPGSEVKIDGQVITEAGLYSFIRRSRETGEMDSIWRVEIYDAPAYDFPAESRTICDGDTVFYGDKAITRAGHYDIVLKTVEGCDSIYHLDLTVNPSYHYLTEATITDYQSYVWMGKTYTTSGSYDRSWPTIHDCDSTYTLVLNVIPTVYTHIDDTICIGQTYSWRGQSITMDGYYVDTVCLLERNFSAVYSLRLVVVYPTEIVSARTNDICADDANFDIHFTYTGQRPTTYSVYFDQYAKKEGFKDIYNAKLGGDMIAHIDLPQFTSICYSNHPYYIRPDNYKVRLVLDNGVCGESSSEELKILIKYPSWIIEQNWDDVVAPLKKEYNGGYDFVQTEWYVNGVKQPNNGNGYLHSDALHEGDEVYMTAIRRGDNYELPTCPIIIQAAGTNGTDQPILVYPTQAPKQAPRITIQAPQGGQYAVFNSTGLPLFEGQLGEGETQVMLPNVSGIYFIRTSHDNEAETHKVLLY